ncbi:MAG: hypothetical protein UY61_C0015G0001, partial [Candidatus Adlerbacteria bacterium GW2011_GWC1_50_9]
MSLPPSDDFLLSLKTSNFSPETIYNYERDLKTFENFLAEDVRLPFSKITKRTLELYKAYLTSRDRKTPQNQTPERILGAGSVNRALSALRRYLKYLIEMDYAAPVAPDSVKLLKLPKKHPRVAEFEDMVRLIESPDSFEKDKKIALRNRTMLETLFATGMRISELLSLNR